MNTFSGKVNGNIQELIADANLDINLKNRSIELTAITLKSTK